MGDVRGFKPEGEGFAGVGDGFVFGVAGGGAAGEFGEDGGPASGGFVLFDEEADIHGGSI